MIMTVGQYSFNFNYHRSMVSNMQSTELLKRVLAQYTLNHINSWQNGCTANAVNINMFCCIQYYLLSGLLDRKHCNFCN